MKEVFVPARGYEGRYEISNLRRVKSLGRKVLRSDGIYRTINERIIYSDKKTMCLGGRRTRSGKNGGNGVDPLIIMTESFYPKYNRKTHQIHSRVAKTKATLSDIMIVKKFEHNPVSVFDGEDVTWYNNFEEFCKRYDLGCESFFRMIKQGWFKHMKYSKFDGWTFAFESPIKIGNQYQIIFTIFDMRYNKTKEKYVTKRIGRI